MTMWVPLSPPAGSYAITGGEAVPTGDVLLELSYKVRRRLSCRGRCR
jgi:hypothetical protein